MYVCMYVYTYIFTYSTCIKDQLKFVFDDLIKFANVTSEPHKMQKQPDDSDDANNHN